MKQTTTLLNLVHHFVVTAFVVGILYLYHLTTFWPTLKLWILFSGYLQHQVYVSFRKYCLEAETLPADLHVVFSDIIQGAGHVDDIFPYFLRHARQMFPHLECMDDLKKISDLRSPANWYETIG